MTWAMIDQRSNGDVYVKAPYDPRLKDAMKEVPTARWDGKAKAWVYIRLPSVMTALATVFEKFEVELRGDALGCPDAPTAGGDVTRTKGPPPWKHQIESAKLVRGFGSYIYGGMGTGKTRSVVDAVCNFGFQRVLIQCPSSVVAVWPKEFEKYAATDVEVLTLGKRGGSIAKRTAAAEKRHRLCEAQGARPLVVVINYEAAWRDPFATWALGMRWSLVVLDEAHKIKSDAGKSSKFCAELRGSADRVTGLSGTPMPHGPLDLFGQFRAIDPGIYGTSATRFKIRYGADLAIKFDTHAQPPTDKLKAFCENSSTFSAMWFGRSSKKSFAIDMGLCFQLMSAAWSDQEIADAIVAHHRIRGARWASRGEVTAVMAQCKKARGAPVSQYSNLEELRAKMDQITIHISRDVLDLPDALNAERFVELSPKERKAHGELWTQLKTIVGTETITASNALVKLLKLQQATSGYATDKEHAEHQIGTSRREVLAEVLEDLGVATDEAVVVFCRFRADLDSVHAAAEKHGVGSLELSGRTNQLEEWQRADAAPVLAVQIQAGGVGVDLTRARYSVYYSIGYSLGDYEQAKARVHRPGQERKVTHVHMIAPGTVDEHVYKALTAKRDVVEFVLETIGSEA